MVMLLLCRSAAPVKAYKTGMLALLSVSAASYGLMRLIEPVDMVGHLVVWHVLPVVALSVIGGIIGRKFLGLS
jgi:uncharacterized membrane protein YfcA